MFNYEQGWNVSGRIDNETLNQKLDALKLKATKFLGSGSWGDAFALSNGRVLKITQDESEADSCAIIKGKKLKHVYNIHRVFKFKSIPEWFFIECEKLIDPGEVDLWDSEVTKLDTSSVKKFLEKHKDDMTKLKKEDRPAHDIALGLLELKRFGITFNDVHENNIMQRSNGDWVIIDIGQSNSPGGKVDVYEAKKNGWQIISYNQSYNILTVSKDGQQKEIQNISPYQYQKIKQGKMDITKFLTEVWHGVPGPKLNREDKINFEIPISIKHDFEFKTNFDFQKAVASEKKRQSNKQYQFTEEEWTRMIAKAKEEIGKDKFLKTKLKEATDMKQLSDKAIEMLNKISNSKNDNSAHIAKGILSGKKRADLSYGSFMDAVIAGNEEKAMQLADSMNRKALEENWNVRKSLKPLIESIIRETPSGLRINEDILPFKIGDTVTIGNLSKFKVKVISIDKDMELFKGKGEDGKVREYETFNVGEVNGKEV